jgi:hypothetical protein
LQNKQGRTRLSKWFFSINDEEKLIIEKEIYRNIILRDVKQTNILEYKNFKVLYKKYASLYFIVGIDSDENELAILEVNIHSNLK